MGSGASSLARLRKALIIRAYNLRKNDETLDEQFRKYSYRNAANQLCISLNDVKTCLDIEAGEYSWIEKVFCHSFGDGTALEMNYRDFINFLESGQVPSSEPGTSSKLPRQGSGRGPSLSSDSGSSKQLNGTFLPDNRDTAHSNPPRPPVVSKDHQIHERNQTERDDEEIVLNINLSQIDSEIHLPDSIKLHSARKQLKFVQQDVIRLSAKLSSTPLQRTGDGEEGEEGEGGPGFTVIVHPTKGASSNALSSSNPQAMWRKREVVRQERSVYYTTVDAEGALQELVEKETTQTEILHMECRDTGEFAHRETTKYEQIETFNEEVVAEAEGQEEYVHLKSLEDEFHYMESTMPKKEDPRGAHHEDPLEDSHDHRPGDQEGQGEGDREGQHPLQEGEHQDDAPLEDYGFDLDRFAAESKEQTSSAHQPRYHMDPAYCDSPRYQQTSGGGGGGEGARDEDKRSETLFGERVVLDENYGLNERETYSNSSSHEYTPMAQRDEPHHNLTESKGDLKEVVGLRASASYESLHEID